MDQEEIRAHTELDLLYRVAQTVYWHYRLGRQPEPAGGAGVFTEGVLSIW